MKIETYKGIQIMHNAEKDEFFTDVVILKSRSSRKNEVIRGGRLQKVRDDIDKFLNTATKKPVLKKAWMTSRRGDTYEQVEIILFNDISHSAMIKQKDGKTRTVVLNEYHPDYLLFIGCKENDAIVLGLNKKNAEIDKINKETSCARGKLIPLKTIHFN